MNNKEWNDKANGLGLSLGDGPFISLGAWNELIKIRKEIKKLKDALREGE